MTTPSSRTRWQYKMAFRGWLTTSAVRARNAAALYFSPISRADAISSIATTRADGVGALRFTFRPLVKAAVRRYHPVNCQPRPG